MLRTLNAIVIMAFAAALLCGSNSTLAKDSQLLVSRGKELFNSVGCYTCHGKIGQGSMRTGPPLAPFQLSDAALSAYVRKPSGLMPPFSASILPESDLAAIAAYLRTLPQTRPPAQDRLLAPFVTNSDVR